jgi:hypothetical protein
MSNYDLSMDLSDFAALDDFALLARQDYNLGGAGDWFGEFRGGLYGFYARFHAVRIHYKIVHAWLPVPRNPTETEYHLSSILFGMDSSLECLTFALNALGFAALPSGFHSVTDGSALSRIKPQDITGVPNKASPPGGSLSGYDRMFPTVKALWIGELTLLERIREPHDVSKHRQTVYVGGMSRLDPPEGFYEALGVGEDPGARSMFWPSAEIILKHDPKAPSLARISGSGRAGGLLEDLAPQFVSLLQRTGKAALEDAHKQIHLNKTELVR